MGKIVIHRLDVSRKWWEMRSRSRLTLDSCNFVHDSSLVLGLQSHTNLIFFFMCDFPFYVFYFLSKSRYWSLYIQIWVFYMWFSFLFYFQNHVIGIQKSSLTLCWKFGFLGLSTSDKLFVLSAKSSVVL